MFTKTLRLFLKHTTDKNAGDYLLRVCATGHQEQETSY